MREFFSQFGKVVDATVMLDRETGRSKGFGFVSFENVNVEPLLGFGNLEIDGKMVCLPAYCQQGAITDSRNHRSMSS
jgi:RNA-binding protein Musashi